RRDWVTPQLDGTLFLNKPPLLYWLTASAFGLAGPSEWARLISVVAGMVALVATCRIGATLYDEPTGLVAGLMLATTLGFVLQVRQLRPDMVVVATIAIAILCWLRAEHAGERRRSRWLAGMYAAIAIGVMAKGAVAVAVAGVPIGLATIRRHGVRSGVAGLE